MVLRNRLQRERARPERSAERVWNSLEEIDDGEFAVILGCVDVPGDDPSYGQNSVEMTPRDDG